MIHLDCSRVYKPMLICTAGRESIAGLWKYESLLLVIEQGNYLQNARFQYMDECKNARPLPPTAIRYKKIQLVQGLTSERV